MKATRWRITFKDEGTILPMHDDDHGRAYFILPFNVDNPATPPGFQTFGRPDGYVSFGEAANGLIELLKIQIRAQGGVV